MGFPGHRHFVSDFHGGRFRLHSLRSTARPGAEEGDSGLAGSYSLCLWHSWHLLCPQVSFCFIRSDSVMRIMPRMDGGHGTFCSLFSSAFSSLDYFSGMNRELTTL